jgi:hypothetical protein
LRYGAARAGEAARSPRREGYEKFLSRPDLTSLRLFCSTPSCGMNEVRYYPIPESEVQKLDELQTQLPLDVEGIFARSNQWTRNNPLAAALIAGLAGFMVGQRLRR